MLAKKYISTAPSRPRQQAIARLHRDLKELALNPLPTVCAKPLEDNIFEWHCNLIAAQGTDYEGAIFHLILRFTEEYPNKPPEVELCTTVARSHVYGNWICLDMLESWGGFEVKPYRGWSTSYSVLSILLQLQSYLFNPVKDITAADVIWCCKNASKYSCAKCPHDMRKDEPWPFEEHMQRPMSFSEAVAKQGHEFKSAFEKDMASFRPSSSEVEKKLAEHRQKVLMQMKLDREKNLKKIQDMEAQKQRQLAKAAAKSTAAAASTGPRIVPGWDPVFAFASSTHITSGGSSSTTPPAPIPSAPVSPPVKPEENKHSAAPAPASASAPTDQPKSKSEKAKQTPLLVLWKSNLNPKAKPFTPWFVAQPNDQPTVTAGSGGANGAKEPSVVVHQTTHAGFEARAGPTTANDFSQEILVSIFSFLDSIDNKRAQQVCVAWKAAATSAHLWEKREMICFHTKRSFEEDVLGIGLTVDWHPKTGEVQYIHTPLELVSHAAFHVQNVRRSVWREEFTHWMPIFINRDHARRGWRLLQESLASMHNFTATFTPQMALNVLPRLMNTMIVDLMNGNTHASIKALQGYCYFHRLLIAFVEEYPVLKKQIDETIRKFIANEENRHKENCPSIGDFLPLLSVSTTYSWKDVALPVLRETWDRNVLWILKKHPELSIQTADQPEPKRGDRAEQSFAASQVSLRLLMFHVYFLENVARPGGKAVDLATMANEYDRRFGRPTHQMQEDLQKAVFDIQAVKDYRGFFKTVHLPIPDDETVQQILRECVLNSLKKRYHSKWIGEKRPQRKPQPKPDSRDPRGPATYRKGKGNALFDEDDFD